MSTDTHLLDLNAVSAYLTKHLPGYSGPLKAEKFQVGQSNPTFQLKTPERDYVLRRKPAGVLLKSAHAVDREFRIQQALAQTAVPVAKMHLLCRDQTIIGSDFYIMDMIEGRNFNLPSLEDVNKADRPFILDEMNRILAALHDVDIDAVGLSDYGPIGNYFERQIGRWSKQYRATETGSIPAMDQLIGNLQKHLPADDGQRTLVHGDYRIDNMIFANEGTHCVALLDWELSTTGHPYADLAAVIMQWQMPADIKGRGLEGINRQAHGLPTDEEFVASYCERRGIKEISNFDFCVAFCFFRFAAVLQGVYKRALDGNASNPEVGFGLAEIIPLLAERGLQAFEAG